MFRTVIVFLIASQTFGTRARVREGSKDSALFPVCFRTLFLVLCKFNVLPWAGPDMSTYTVCDDTLHKRVVYSAALTAAEWGLKKNVANTTTGVALR